MVKSMTGYGQAIQKLDDLQLSVEVKTVNHRFLDYSFKMPRELMPFEEQMKKQIKNFVVRGRVDIFIHINGQSLKDQTIRVNWPILNQYIQRIEEIKQQTKIEGEFKLDQLFQLDDVFVLEEQGELGAEVEEALYRAMDEAINDVYAMRVEEGEALKHDVLKYCEEIERMTSQLDEEKDEIKQAYYDKVSTRLKEFGEISIDESRLLQEIALLTDKGDITEEITRILSHVEQIRGLVNSDEAIGRRLDFLTQELHREANTIGSKSNDVQLSKIAVALKSVIEKIKEQVQNIE
ncbi:YicC/YloC family endoribonuclease [Alkalibacillus silvisoli]|uniref:YicC family protein n=1 Tax=Alkalibacillus silvisoli TaxID=392823 RepID=A0ABP3JPZ9_9BACI